MINSSRRGRPWAPAVVVVLCLLVCAGRGWGQSSQASLFGRVTGAGAAQQPSGRPATSQQPGGRPATLPVPKALVILRNLQTNMQKYVFTNDQGLYSFAAVAPGVYTVRVDAPPGFTAEERSPVELPVSSRIELDFSLKAGAVSVATAAAPVTARAATNAREIQAIMYGADAAVPQAVVITLPVQATETLVGSVSSLIDERKILELPLSGRDVYTLLVLQPGVTADNATARGLGFSVNGQRVASSNFLLDGVDNNDLLVTGAATKVSADAVKEYRMSINNYSAEFGRASGFIANAITRSGTNELHGTLYEFFNHDRLNANTFSNNCYPCPRLPLPDELPGFPRVPYRENQYGASLGGPVVRDRIFFFGNFERAYSSSRSQEQQVFMPSKEFVSLLREGSIAKRLMTMFPPPDGEPVPGFPFAVNQKYFLPIVQGKTFALGRADYTTANGKHRFSGRYSFSEGTTENFFFSTYPGLNEPLAGRGQNLSTNYTRDLLGGSNELKFGISRNSVRFLRPHPDVPTFLSADTIALPGSEAPYDYFFRDTILHFLDNYSRLSGRHALGIGFEWRQGLHDSLLSPARDGLYIVSSIFDFLRDDPELLLIALGRQTGRPATDAEFRRYYGQKEFAAFVQDNLKLTRRLTLNLGARFEYFGVPNPRKSTRDHNFVFGRGSNIGERIATGGLEAVTHLFRPDRNNFAPRFGFALDVRGDGKSVLRGGYGVFFDRIFNNFWMDARGNSITLQFLTISPDSPFRFQYSIPAARGVQPVPLDILQGGYTVAIDGGLRTPYGQSWFLSFQHALTPDLVAEVSHLGSLGRKLVTADTINRLGSVPSPEGALLRFNDREPEISYRSNQGTSDFTALGVEVRRRWSKRYQFQVSYTMSRTRDVQSDPYGARAAADPRARRVADFFQIASAFTRQFDPRADYGLSDFDQTHNLVLNGVAVSPPFQGWRRLFGVWEVAALAGFRSGFPFSVFAGGCETFLPACVSLKSNRADFVGRDREEAYLTPRRPVPGGLLILDRTKFRAPEEGKIGNLPRNALRSPGFWNTDFAFSRNFALPRFGEAGRIQFRAEFFNLFNHTNLANPDKLFRSETFGEAPFGRQGVGASLPGVSPLNEQPRRIQFALKIYF